MIGEFNFSYILQRWTVLIFFFSLCTGLFGQKREGGGSERGNPKTPLCKAGITKHRFLKPESQNTAFIRGTNKTTISQNVQ